MNDLITIIINVYNGEKYIKKCLECIINQTYNNLEILVINDGSTDNTLKICKSYNDKRIRIITTKNLWLSKSRNVGIENSKGKYLYFIDVDDLIDLDTIEYLYNLCIKYNKDIATSNKLMIYDYNYKVKQPEEQIEEIDSKEMLKKIFLKYENSVAIWHKLIKKDLFENLRFEDRIINDVAFTHKLVMKTDKIVYSNQIKYYHLKNRDSISRKKFEDFDRTIDLYKATVERFYYVNKKYPDFIENNYACLELITQLYLRKSKNIIKYLNESGARKTYKELFSHKVLKCKINRKQKIKLILFRINPKLNSLFNNAYLGVRVNRFIK